MSNGLKDQKDDFTVGDLQEILSIYPKNLPVYFGANIKFKTYHTDDYGHETEVETEFDDWLEFKEIKTSTQAYGKRGDIKIRHVLSIELKY